MISRSALKTVSIFLLLSSLIEVDAATASHRRRRGSSTRKLGVGYQSRMDTETSKGKGDGKSKGGKGKGDSGTADGATVESPTPAPNVSGPIEPTPSDANGDTFNPDLNPGLGVEDSLDGRIDDLTKGDTNGNENGTNLELIIDITTGGSLNGANTDVDGTTPSDSTIGTIISVEDISGNINGDGSTSIEVGTGNEGDDEADGNEGVEGTGNNGATEEGSDSNGTAGTVTGGGATGESGSSSSGVEGSNGSGTAGESGSSISGVGGSDGSGTTGESGSESGSSGVGGSEGSGTTGENGSGSSGVEGSDGSGTAGENGSGSSSVEGSDGSGTAGENGSGSSEVGGSDGSGTTGESGSSGVGGSNASGAESNTDGANGSDGSGNGSDEGSSTGEANNPNDVGDSGEVFDSENIWGVPSDDIFLDSDITTAVFCPEVSPDKEVLVNWIYAVEFLPELTTEEKSIAVTIMELKLVSELLECGTVALPGKLRNRNRHLLQVLEEGIAGLNYMPLDAKNDDVVCFFSNSTSDGVCETYFGRMEMYLQEDITEQNAINKILYAIRDTMQRSDFPAVDGIKRVWYLDPDLNEISGISDGDGILDRQPPVDTSFSTGTMIAFAALGVFVFAALVLGAFRMRRNETDVITQFGDSTMAGSEQKSTFSAMLPNSYKLDDAEGMSAIPEGSSDTDSRYNCSVILSEGGYTSDGDSHVGDPSFPTNFDNVLGTNKSDEDDLQIDNEMLFENNFSDNRQMNLVAASEVSLGVKHSAIDVHQCTSAQCSICDYKPNDVEFVHKSPNTPDISMTKFFPDEEGNNDA